MNFEIDVDPLPHCCGIGNIKEYVKRFDDPLADAKQVRETIQRWKVLDGLGDPGPNNYVMYIATTVQGRTGEYLEKVYKAAGFKKLGRTMVNPNSGNTLTKWYLDAGARFKA